jgi:hypothetical protein
MTDWKLWFKYAAIRAVRTVAQAALAIIGSSAILADVNWGIVASGAALAGIISLLTSIATELPEVRLERLAKDNEECYVHMAKEANELREELHPTEEEDHDDE